MKTVTDRDDFPPAALLVPAFEPRARAPVLDDEAPIRGASRWRDSELRVAEARESLVLPAELVLGDVCGLEDEVIDTPGGAATAAQPAGGPEAPKAPQTEASGGLGATFISGSLSAMRRRRTPTRHGGEIDTFSQWDTH